MSRSAVAPALVVGAAIVAVAGAPALARVTLLAAIPFAALAVLDAVSATVSSHGTRLAVGARVASLVLLLAGVLTGMPGIALLGVAALAVQPLGAFSRPHRVARRRALPADR